MDAAASQRPLRQRAARDVAIQVVARALNLVLGAVVLALLARTLGDSGMGQWGTLTALIGILAFFMDFGLTTVTVREAAADPENEGTWISSLLALQMAVVVPVTVVAAVLVAVMSTNDSMLVAGLILVLPFPLTVGSALGAVFRIRMANGIPMAMLTVNSVSWGIAVIVVDLTGGGLVALAVAMSSITVVVSLTTAALALRLVKLARPTRAGIRRLVDVGLPFGLSGMVTIAYARIDQLLVFSLAGSAAAGHYGVAYRVLEGVTFIPASLMITLAPVMAASWPGDRARLIRVARQATEYLVIGGLGVLVFVLATADQLMLLVFGPEFVEAADALRILTAAFVVICVGYVFDQVMLIVGQQVRMLWISVLGLAVNVGLNFALIPPFGYVGAAWGTFATEVVVQALSVASVMVALGITRVALGRLPRIVLVAGALLVLLELADGVSVPLSGLTAIAAVGYPAMLLAARALTLDEVRLAFHRRSPGIA